MKMNGSSEPVRALIIPILEDQIAAKAGEAFGIVTNPECLREGTSVDDFLHSNRLIFGADDPKALADMQAVFVPTLARLSLGQIHDC
jgi:UDPglucose 6-dehydrogenase